MLDCGVISKETGQWEGITTSDPQFIGITRALGVANGGEILVPDTDAYPSIDMAGFEDIFVAIKPSNGGNCAIQAIMGPDTQPFGELSPVNAAAGLKGKPAAEVGSSLLTLFLDSSESLTADVWNIFIIQSQLRNQMNMQFKITNNSGGSSDIEFAIFKDGVI